MVFLVVALDSMGASSQYTFTFQFTSDWIRRFKHANDASNVTKMMLLIWHMVETVETSVSSFRPESSPEKKNVTMLHIRSKLVERFFVEIIWKKNSWQISQCQHHLQPMSWLPWGMPAWTTCKPLNMGAFFPVVCLTRLNPWWNCPKECAFKSFREPHISSLTVLHPDSIAKLLLLEIPTWAHDMHWQRAPQTCLALLNISYGTTCYIAFPCISCCLMLSWCCHDVVFLSPGWQCMEMHGVFLGTRPSDVTFLVPG